MGGSLKRMAQLSLVTCTCLGLVTGCSRGEVEDSTPVVGGLNITAIIDNTGSDYYSVTSARLDETSVGVELTLTFDITNANGATFSPVAVIDFGDDIQMTCKADDLRRVPSLRESTVHWGFACDLPSIPDERSNVTATITDSYMN